MSSDGKKTIIPSSYYKSPTSTMLFAVTHPGTFEVISKKVVFTDVPDSNWSSKYVNFLAAREIVSGMSATEKVYQPDSTLSRAQFVKMLETITAGIAPELAKKSAFSDVASDSWYENFVSLAAEKDVVKGYGDGTFGPNDVITREQMCSILCRFSKAAGYTLSSTEQATVFTDEGTISAWAYSDVKTLQKTGIIGGRTDASFDPGETATRAEASKVVYKLLMDMLGQ